MEALGIRAANPMMLPESRAARLEKTEQAARAFEAMFATQMLAPMYEGLEVDDVFGGGHGEEVFRTMMLQEYGKAVATSNSLGLAQTVKQEMLRLQEAR